MASSLAMTSPLARLDRSVGVRLRLVVAHHQAFKGHGELTGHTLGARGYWEVTNDNKVARGGCGDSSEQLLCGLDVIECEERL